MNSMTGFGLSDYRDTEVDVSIEIKTINHRYKDFFFKIPKALNPLEERMRKAIGKYLFRGRIEVYVKYNEINANNRNIVLNRDICQNYIDVLHQIKKMDSMISDELSVETIARFPDVVFIEEKRLDDDAVWQILEPVLMAAINGVVSSRMREGNNLKENIKSHCIQIEKAIGEIEAYAPNMVTQHVQALKDKVKEYADSVGIDENRILMEMAILSDKLAIDEELTRLKIHTDHFINLLDNSDALGRKLDFLLQEMNREINTIGSKATEIEISNRVVEVKSEIEKIREQIQNIE